MDLNLVFFIDLMQTQKDTQTWKLWRHTKFYQWCPNIHWSTGGGNMPRHAVMHQQLSSWQMFYEKGHTLNTCNALNDMHNVIVIGNNTKWTDNSYLKINILQSSFRKTFPCLTSALRQVQSWIIIGCYVDAVYFFEQAHRCTKTWPHYSSSKASSSQHQSKRYRSYFDYMVGHFSNYYVLCQRNGCK